MIKLMVAAASAFLLLMTSPVYALSWGDEEVDQKNLCEVSEWRADAVAGVCEPGQKVVFLPRQFGNEQLPIYFAAVNCDLRYSVAMTNGGVTCIYQPIEVEAQE